MKREAASAVRRSTEALSEMLERLLDVSRFDSGMVVASPRTFRLRPLLADLAAGLAAEAERCRCVITSVGPDLCVFADPVLLLRVVQNLGINAIRHSKTDRVLLSLRQRGGACVIQVWDQGRGIPPEDQTRIYEEFVQLDNKARERERGLGMGLALVQRMCELNQWPLVLRSIVGRGSVFSVTVPLSVEVAQEPIMVGAYPPLGLRVLLVEDDPLARVAATQWLEGLECHVVCARSGTEALHALDDTAAFDIVITDHDLPGELTGVDVVERLKSRMPAIPAVILSGDPTFPTPADLARLGGSFETPVLAKPVEGYQLWATIQKVLSTEQPVP